MGRDINPPLIGEPGLTLLTVYGNCKITGGIGGSNQSVFTPTHPTGRSEFNIQIKCILY